ncbi:hypothetical protein DAPPUDRAFT_328299 [Daphnia pulex]|uniref:DH domain-containing protein n=1 Tax=Daphnia pulex TaxID=6669 RepID=E9HCS2_DAPPU|nr:hypothetical protein DAPPUDRAFT_328299 [Daphnia pulex]|eukprot:EFX70397.1 hypothetical protein DAPPUDRAFT_328299 [Daphnia pulex]
MGRPNSSPSIFGLNVTILNIVICKLCLVTHSPAVSDAKSDPTLFVFGFRMRKQRDGQVAMYDMKVKTPPMASKRRSWTGRLKDRFKSSAGQYGTVVVSSNSGGVESHMAGPGEDWTSAWVTHPHLQEGHHAPSVPSLQGSVFVAANFVYDYRKKYGLDPANGWMATPAVGSIAIRRTTDWTTTRGLYPVRTSPVFRAADPSMEVGPMSERKAIVQSKMAEDHYGTYEFRAADVNQNIRQMRENKQQQQQQQHRVSVSHAAPPLPTSVPPPLYLSDDDADDGESDASDESPPQTTVAVDRPGLIVSGQRICILTGQDSPAAIKAEKVCLKVEFQRSCPLRRSLSDRARPKMAAPASFHDTTRLTQKTRSRGSLHDLFGLSPPDPLTIPVTTTATPPEPPPAPLSPNNRRKTIVRPTEPPPPPPPPTPVYAGVSIKVGTGPESPDDDTPPPPPPVAPPRRIYRHSKTDNDSLPRDSSAASVPVTPLPTLDLSPGITSWAGRPLIGQVPLSPDTTPTVVFSFGRWHDSLVCHRCARRRCERREVLAELLETEVRYGRDLRVLQDELYKPLLVAGLVPLRQLDAVFLNVTELSGQSQRFGQRLREAVEIALEQGDEDLLTVDVARLFLDKETEEMMDAFRRYCVRSGEASLLLSTLEKERELLRIFLRASQLENPALRRMDLHAFLMVPVQRITKYPLLLGRLLRATAQQDVEMREALREAQAKVESYLTAINAEAKELGTVSRPWRRGYSVPNLNANNASANSSTMQRPSGEELMNLRLRKLAMDCLGWSDNAAAQLVMEGYVKLTQPGELLLTTTRSRGRTLKWQNVWMGLVTLNHQDSNKTNVFELGGETVADSAPVTFGVKPTVQEAAVVLIKDVKNARPGPSIYRDPLMLSYCTISSEADELPNFFEIHHIVTKESFICQTIEAGQTQQWLHRLRTLSLGLGRWKQRRNALPHVMMIN